MANIAIDFDGTIVTHEFPKIGRLLPGAKETMQALWKNGHKIFLWTMRGYNPKYKRCLEEAVAWLDDHGIGPDGINRTTSEFSTTSPKQYANLYIDDAALGCPLCIYPTSTGETGFCADWFQIANILQRIAYINVEQHKEIHNDIVNTYDQQGITYRPHYWPTSPSGFPTAQ